MKTDKFLRSQTGLLVIVAFFVYIFTSQRKKVQDLQKEVEDPAHLTDLSDLPKNVPVVQQSINAGNKKNYTDSKYREFADNLFNYLHRFNVDEEGVYRVFNLIKNDTDYLYLNSAFGRRMTDFFWRTSWTNKSYTMKELLSSQLDSNEKKDINDLLSQRGLTKTVYLIK